MNTLHVAEPARRVRQAVSLPVILVLGILWLPASFTPHRIPTIAGDWYIDRKEAVVSIYQQADDRLYGRIIWASDPTDNRRLQRETKPVLVLKRFRQEATNSQNPRWRRFAIMYR
ncbi:MAG: hypothetical protein H7Z72_13180 [Bacteroidetes bacterium]|nr:hypothetical protein [Fibrella sp.]